MAALIGAVLAIGAAGALELDRQGQIALGDSTFVAWLGLIGLGIFALGLVYAAVRQMRVRAYLPPERYRGPSVLILLALVFIGVAVLSAPFGADSIALLEGSAELTLVGSVVVLTATQVSLLFVSWFFVFRPRALTGTPAWVGADPWGAVRSGLVWGLAAWFGATLLSGLIATLLEAMGMDVTPEVADQAIAVVEPWVVVLALVILAPIAEEVFFRGIAFNAWLRERGRRWAFIGSSALFALIHVSLVSLIPIFLLGLVLAWVYQRRQSLLAPIVLHATINGISVAIALLERFGVISLPAA